MRECVLLVFWIASVVPVTVNAAPPAGQSALLNGMHDIESVSWMKNATSGCDKGWVTDLKYIGTQGTPGVDCHTGATQAGISIIQRLDVSGTESFPHNASQAAGYAKNFAHYASKCPNIHVWIVGNEPNFTVHKSDPDCSSSAYAKAYVEVHKRVHALPGHQNDVLLVASNSPFSPGCLESMRQIVKEIKAAGITPDGFALHPYTRASTGSALNASYVTNTSTQQDNTINECPGNASWSDTWHSHFRIYIDYIKAIEALGVVGKPMFFTESGNACEPTIQNNACYPDADVGYFQALYKEAHRWNQLSTTKSKIRAITPYRWTINDDGTGRDFAIGRRANLLSDLKKAFAQKYSWTSSACGTSKCVKDADCPSGKRCDTSTGACISVTPTHCTPQQCGAQVCSPSSCPSEPGGCVSKGSGQFSFQPTPPLPHSLVRVSFVHPTGWAYIGLTYCGPTQGEGTNLKIDKAPNGQFRWSFDIGPVAEGVYRVSFTADKGAKIIGSVQMVVQAPCTPSQETCNNKDDDCNGQIDDGLQRTCYTGPAGTASNAPCRAGQQLCVAGQWGSCQGEQRPLPNDICHDNVDNDCNGLVDDQCTQPESSQPDAKIGKEVSAPEPVRREESYVQDGGGVVIIEAGPQDKRQTFRTGGAGCRCEGGPGESVWMWPLLLLFGAFWFRRRGLV